MKLSTTQKETLSEVTKEAREALNSRFNTNEINRFYSHEKAALPLSIIDFLLKKEMEHEEIAMFKLILSSVEKDVKAQYKNLTMRIFGLKEDIKKIDYEYEGNTKLLEDLKTACKIVKLCGSCANFAKQFITEIFYLDAEIDEDY